MRSSAAGDERHPTARCLTRAALALIGLGCASAAPTAAPPPPPPAPPAGALQIELHFGAEADLDLYVSDPLRETAYFANTPVASGGTHRQDLRCDAAAPRVEVVVWQTPPPGRYRIGVDFPERCADGISRAPYRLRVLGPGGPQELEAEAAFGRFAPRVLEFEIPD